MTDPRLRARADRAFREEMFPEWAKRGACVGHDTDDWFADDVADHPTPRFPERVYRAMCVCYGCPVRVACLEDAFILERREEAGIWWSGEPIEEKRRFGVRGGIPGRIREDHAEDPQRLQVLESWLEMVAERRRWLPPRAEEATA